MKKVTLIAFVVVVLSCGIVWTGAMPTTPARDYEVLNLKVLKVFSAKDGEAWFRAYMVKWKDQEVIVDDTLAKTNYNEGDTIRVLAMRNKYPNNKPGPDLLHFAVTPPPGLGE